LYLNAFIRSANINFRSAQAIHLELQQTIRNRKIEGKKTPTLVAVLVGEDGGSLTYVTAKLRACQEIGFDGRLVHLSDSIREDELLEKISELNSDRQVDGFLVQLPLPAHIDEAKVIQTIDPKKDIDGFHPENVGRMVLNLSCFLPATPFGIIELIRRNEIETEGKHCVVIGRSNIVGMPLSILLSKNNSPGNCTVTLAHSKTNNLKELCLQADIVVSAIGKPHSITADMIRPGAVVIDVGTTRVADSSRERGWRLCGDVDFQRVAPKCSFITPVPGGVGPMTIAQLMINTLKAVEMQEKQIVEQPT